MYKLLKKIGRIGEESNGRFQKVSSDGLKGLISDVHQDFIKNHYGVTSFQKSMFKIAKENYAFHKSEGLCLINVHDSNDKKYIHRLTIKESRFDYVECVHNKDAFGKELIVLIKRYYNNAIDDNKISLRAISKPSLFVKVGEFDKLSYGCFQIFSLRFCGYMMGSEVLNKEKS